jgi:hypothetical protein
VLTKGMHMDTDARDYWYYSIGLALVVALVALAG